MTGSARTFIRDRRLFLMGAKPQADEQEALILQSVDRFVEREIRPVAHKLEAADTYPASIVEKMKALGLFGATIAEGRAFTVDDDRPHAGSQPARPRGRHAIPDRGRPETLHRSGRAYDRMPLLRQAPPPNRFNRFGCGYG